MFNVDFPYHFDADGRTAGVGLDGHIRDLIEQVLFTAPGERVNRPEFGSGLMQLVFAPNSQEMLAATHFLVQAALQQNLSDLIEISKVEVGAEDSTLRVTIEYVVRNTQQQQVAQFTRGGLQQ
jgi:phage baseplate assembly protein W